jgi:dTDP-4-dehydrorhamnose reductase
MDNEDDTMKILIIGNGFIGTRLHEMWKDSVLSGDIIATADDVRRLLKTHMPDAVVNAAGVRGKPNVDWCETHQLETILGNTALPILIAEACQEKNIYLLHIGSGCIFYGASPDPNGWREEDFGNPLPVYSRAKYAADLVLSTLPNVGIARIRMPIDAIPGPHNLIDKLARFPKVIDVENSVTVIDDMVDVFHELVSQRAAGIFHVTNPGTIRHREILAMYEELADPSHRNEWISNDDLVRQGLAARGRSNNHLQSNNLEALGIAMRPVHEAVRDTMKAYAAHLHRDRHA